MYVCGACEAERMKNDSGEEHEKNDAHGPANHHHITCKRSKALCMCRCMCGKKLSTKLSFNVNTPSL